MLNWLYFFQCGAITVSYTHLDVYKRQRVGRSNRTSYAFLMYKRDKMLKEIAEKRLHAIREFTELGSGFKIAMRDLELRGSGNLLGAVQHGHMESVGYDLYCKMLSEAVKEAKGIPHQEDFETTVDLELRIDRLAADGAALSRPFPHHVGQQLMVGGKYRCLLYTSRCV